LSRTRSRPDRVGDQSFRERCRLSDLQRQLATLQGGGREMTDPAAVHEAGHVVVAVALGMRATGVRLDDNGGGAVRTDPSAMFILRLPYLEMFRRRIMVGMAGGEAECELCGKLEPETDNGDRENVMRLLAVVPILGAELSLLRHRARTLVRRHRPSIEALAAVLRERGSLSGREIERLLASSGRLYYAVAYQRRNKAEKFPRCGSRLRTEPSSFWVAFAFQHRLGRGG
jgi:hypothetical protein